MNRRSGNIDRTYGHIDFSTADTAPNVTRHFSLFTHLDTIDGYEKEQEWKFALELPFTIDDALDSSDWDLVLTRLQQREDDGLSPIEKVVFTAALAKSLGHNVSGEDVNRRVSQTVASNLYRIFCEKQIKAGNKAWIQPVSLARGVQDEG